MTRRPALDKDLAIDIMASWALEAMTPSQQTIEDIRALVDGTMTFEEFMIRTQEIAGRSSTKGYGASPLSTVAR